MEHLSDHITPTNQDVDEEHVAYEFLQMDADDLTAFPEALWTVLVLTVVILMTCHLAPEIARVVPAEVLLPLELRVVVNR
jgi:hypothetical protein